MIGGLLQRWREHRERKLLERFAISDSLWQLTLAHYPFLARRDEADRAELRRLCSLFLASKEFHGARGLTVTDEMAVAIAAQACLPVLRLGLDWYDRFLVILVHEGEVLATREVMDEDGVVQVYEEPVVGEAPGAGPMMLAWNEITPQAAHRLEGMDPVYNVVIHEFAHIFTMDAPEGAEGLPPIADKALRARWQATMEAEWDWFCDQVDAGVPTLIDPYGESSLEEFYAVAVEAFFVAPRELLAEQPRLYRLFVEFFRQDPARD